MTVYLRYSTIKMLCLDNLYSVVYLITLLFIHNLYLWELGKLSQYSDYAISWMTEESDLIPSRCRGFCPQCPDQLWDSPSLVPNSFLGGRTAWAWSVSSAKLGICGAIHHFSKISSWHGMLLSTEAALLFMQNSLSNYKKFMYNVSIIKKSNVT